MKLGDFTALARAYVHRPAYAEPVVDALLALSGRPAADLTVADVGAGTGKLTEMLARRSLGGYAVEPNSAMRAEGVALGLRGFDWLEAPAETIPLDDNSVDLVTMASAFHWTDAPRALAEFHRILRPGGALSLLWNPRDLARDPLQQRIEARIGEIAPTISRRSSGAAPYTADLEDTLLASGLFTDLLFLEAPHVERMTRARHLGAWRSVNDIRAQAGEAAWTEILEAIEGELADHPEVEVRYRTRAWIVRKV
jgi:SAM-dependent methyltransferase